jgi:hypothetical protein
MRDIFAKSAIMPRSLFREAIPSMKNKKVFTFPFSIL